MLDRGETPVEQARSRQFFRVRHEPGLEPGEHFQLLRDENIAHIGVDELRYVALGEGESVIAGDEAKLHHAMAQRTLGGLVESALASIVKVHFPDIKPALLTTALTQFFEIRETPGLKKMPSTSEVLDWLKLLLAEDLAPEDLKRDGKHALPKLHGALLKNEQDVHLFERLAFIARGQR